MANFNPPLSIFELNRLSDSSAAGAGEVEFEIVAFGVEHVNRIAAVAFDAAVKFAEFLGLLQCRVIVFPSQTKGLVSNTVLVDGVAVYGPRTGEQHYVMIAAA